MNEDIQFDVKNHLGRIILNRPQALNALRYDMFEKLIGMLAQWRDDETIKAVLVRSTSEKAFCAGGDIRAVYENRHRPVDELSEYFRLEYSINRPIFHYPKPYIALTHGITMGGGVGISLHASHCVAAENLRWAMPETLIGFFPDVGATYQLSRLPNEIGTYLALTGNSIGAYDANTLQLTKYVVPYNQFDALETKIVETPFDSTDFDAVTQIIQLFSLPKKTSLTLPVEKISMCFCFDTVEEIIQALEKDQSEWAQDTAKQLLQRSPTSLKVTLKQLRAAKHKTFDEVSFTDFHIAHEMLSHHDFIEGIRAAIIDKDKSPQWRPALLSEVSRELIGKYFNK